MNRKRALHGLLPVVASVVIGGVHLARAQEPDPSFKRDAEVRSRWDRTEFERTFSHHTAQVGDGANSVNIHSVTGGQGNAVVLLHGYPATWYGYRMVMPLLAKKYTVIAIDLRGMGDSGKSLTGYDPRTMAQDAHQVVTKLGFKNAYVVGTLRRGFAVPGTSLGRARGNLERYREHVAHPRPSGALLSEHRSRWRPRRGGRARRPARPAL